MEFFDAIEAQFVPCNHELKYIMHVDDMSSIYLTFFTQTFFFKKVSEKMWELID